MVETQEDKGYIHTSFRAPPDVHASVKERASRMGLSMSQFIVFVLTGYFNNPVAMLIHQDEKEMKLLLSIPYPQDSKGEDE